MKLLLCLLALPTLAYAECRDVYVNGVSSWVCDYQPQPPVRLCQFVYVDNQPVLVCNYQR